MTQQAVTYSVDADGICTLTMDLPGKPLNVLGEELQPALAAAVERALADQAVKGIIVTSGKETFVAGADLKAMDAGFDFAGRSMDEIVDASMSLSRDLRRLETGGKPVACAINGVAVGGGFEIALACHYRVVADDPRIMLGLPEVGLGLLPGAGGTQRVLRMLGFQAAAPVLMQGKLLNPSKALDARLVDKVVHKDQLLVEARRWLMEMGDPVAPWDKRGFKIPGGNAMTEEGRNFFNVSNAMTRANSYGNYPAASAIASCMFEGSLLPMDLALRIEAKYFVKLYQHPVSGAMVRTLFVNKGRAEKLEARPAGVTKADLRRIGIIGAGTMGAGLALNAAKAGLEVVLLDRDHAAAERGKEYAVKRLTRDVEKGRSTQEKADHLLARIQPTTSYEALKDVKIVVEAVFEDRTVKKDVIRQAEAVLPADAVIASNTSALPISELAQFSSRPECFIGMHFFSPAEKMPLVEIIRGRSTSDAALAWAMDLAQAMRKTPIVVNDSPGFFTTRFISAYISECMKMINDGVNPILVENAARMVGMPMGPMTISDSIGLDLGHYVAVEAARERGEAEPDTGIIGKLVTQFGRHGVKNGKGFYDYAPDGTKTLWPGLVDLLPRLAQQPSVNEVKQRILYAQLAEGARAFAEGVLVSAIDGDLGAVLGVGFPAYLGGPYSAIDRFGAAEVAAECDRLAAAYGPQFAVPQLLRDMAKDGRTFHGSNAVKSPGARV